MGTIMERPNRKGASRFTALIRKKQNGKVILTLTETFPSRQAADRWIKHRERDLKEKGAVERMVQSRQRKTWSEVIADYCEASPDKFGKTKTANLAYLQRLDFGTKPVEETSDHDFVTLARDLLRGVQAPPGNPEHSCPEHFALKPRMPQTVNTYLATLRTVVMYGGPISRVEMPIGDFETAVRTLKHQRIVSKSAIRSRRPTVDEMNKLMSHFYARYQSDKRRVPMHKVIAGAITLSHRQSALCSLPWRDFNFEANRLWIRNMKHPRQTQGNDVEVWVTDEAKSLIESMPRNNDRIFPYCADVVSRLFTEACALLNIHDLHFHDLRHDAISRFFEIALGGGSRHMILKYTGHSPDGSLTRYIHIDQTGDKYEGWSWWPILLAPL